MPPRDAFPGLARAIAASHPAPAPDRRTRVALRRIVEEAQEDLQGARLATHRMSFQLQDLGRDRALLLAILADFRPTTVYGLTIEAAMKYLGRDGQRAWKAAKRAAKKPGGAVRAFMRGG